MEAIIAENPNNSLKISSASTTTSPSPSQNPRTQFPTYLDTPAVSRTARIICEILTHASPQDIESSLSSTGIVPSPELVLEVLKLSYNSVPSAVDFFRWAGRTHKHCAYAWDLMVDILGKNHCFDQMWEAIRSMKQEGLLSLVTFTSVFTSYSSAGQYQDAVKSFDVMNMHSVEQDVRALNSLLAVICLHHNQMMLALDFFYKHKDSIPPDAHTFAILLQGLNKQGNLVEARKIFGQMVDHIGWSTQNLSSYETFLTMLVRGRRVSEFLTFLRVMKTENCLPSLKYFSYALDILVKQNDSIHALVLWDIMVGNGLVPNLIMYNALIGLLCNNNDLDNAFRFLDEMVFHGAFADSLTYNMIFQCLIKNNRVSEVGNFFCEMIKNEWLPSHLSCADAITMLLDGDEPEMAIEIWSYMVEIGILPLEVSANALLIGFRNMGRLPEVKRFAEDMLDRRIIIYEVTMHKLKNAFYKESRSVRDKYDNLEKRWRISHM